MEKIITISHLTKKYRMYSSPRDRICEALGIKKNINYKDYYALNNISFDVKKGEIVGIIGRNGSGKSTLLKIITGVLNASDGEIEVKGKVSALLELGAGFNMEYTGKKNIYLNASMMHISHEEIEKKLPQILEFADIGEYINQPVKTYSSGMFIRLAFAVAINVNPDILIVDEAFAVGDTRFQLKCMDKFLEFVNAGKTILFVSHDINAIKRFCNRAIWINQGNMIMDGNMDEVTDRYMDYLKSELSIEEYTNKFLIKKDDKELTIVDEDSSIDIVSIRDFKIYNSKGYLIENINHGERVKLKISYYVKDESIVNPVLGVAIHGINGDYICGINTKLDKERIPWKKGLNEIELIYENFNIVGGEYCFDVGIFDQTASVTLDYKSRIKIFFVNMNYIAEGIVVLEHSWHGIM